MIPVGGFPQRAYYAAPIGVGVDGIDNYGPAVLVEVRSEAAFQVSPAGDGYQGNYSASVLLTPAAMVPGGLVWLPGRDQTKRDQALRVTGVQPATDVDGVVDYYQVTL